MKTHVLKGTKQEITDGLARIPGDFFEAIVFEEDPVASTQATNGHDDLFAEMRPHMVDVDRIDDSRDAIYTRMDGE